MSGRVLHWWITKRLTPLLRSWMKFGGLFQPMAGSPWATRPHPLRGLEPLYQQKLSALEELKKSVQWVPAERPDTADVRLG